MSEISSQELGRQLMKPSGEVGLKVAEKMNSSNTNLYNFVLSLPMQTNAFTFLPTNSSICL